MQERQLEKKYSESLQASLLCIAAVLTPSFQCQGALQNLSLVVNLTKHIRVRAGEDGEEETGQEFADVFPSLLWVVRDFALQLVSPGGLPISQREYLENSLQMSPGVSLQVQEKNRVRRMLQAFFPQRDCVTLKRPVEDEGMMQVRLPVCIPRCVVRAR